MLLSGQMTTQNLYEFSCTQTAVADSIRREIWEGFSLWPSAAKIKDVPPEFFASW